MSNQTAATEQPQEAPKKSAKLKKLVTKNRVQHAATATIAAGLALIVYSRVKSNQSDADVVETTEAPAEA